MKTRKIKPFDIERVKEFCKLVNEGNTPVKALVIMSSSTGYATPLKRAGFFWQEKDGTYKAVERIYSERYNLFVNEKKIYIKKRNDSQYAAQKQLRLKGINSTEKTNSYKEYTKQASLFNQPKPKQPTTAPTLKTNEPQLTFIQRVVKSLFNL
jgi:hypothetical protein